jgi:hypothetical protein
VAPQGVVGNSEAAAQHDRAQALLSQGERQFRPREGSCRLNTQFARALRPHLNDSPVTGIQSAKSSLPCALFYGAILAIATAVLSACTYDDDGPDPNWHFLKLEMDAPQGNTVIVCQPRYACLAVLLTQKDDRPALYPLCNTDWQGAATSGVWFWVIIVH